MITNAATVKNKDNFILGCKCEKRNLVQERVLVYERTYLKDQCYTQPELVSICQVKFLTILLHQIQLPSTDLHYPAKYFWHLTKISNIKELHIAQKIKQNPFAFSIQISTFAFSCLTLALNHSE